MMARPPLLTEAANRIPALRQLLSVPGAPHVRIYGAAMWEYLTDRPYLRRESDFDLLWEAAPGFPPSDAMEFFHAADAVLPGRIDGEISFPGLGEVAWRELAGNSTHLLAKSLNQVSLVERSALPGFVAGSQTPLADAAVDALLEELSLFPKPGLVSGHDSGSHDDMDFALMQESAHSLHEFFAEIERNPGDFDACLKSVGIRAETRMLDVTGGVNTHRGAIFLLGLLIASAARTPQRTAGAIRQSLEENYGLRLQSHAHQAGSAASPAAGARAEAALGFPSVFELALPHFQGCISEGCCRQAAALDTLTVLISRADDTNLLRRGGPDGSARARRIATEFLRAGGVRSIDWLPRLLEVHRVFVTNRWSPGGCADLLAATLFLESVCA